MRDKGGYLLNLHVTKTKRSWRAGLEFKIIPRLRQKSEICSMQLSKFGYFFPSLPFPSATSSSTHHCLCSKHCTACCSPSRHRCLFQILLLIQFFQVAGLSTQKKTDLALDSSLGFLYLDSVASGELDSLQETDQNMLSPNVQQSETKPTPATASLPVHLMSSTYVVLWISHALFNWVTLLSICNAYSLLAVVTLSVWLVQFVFMFEHSPGACPSIQCYMCLCKPLPVFS